MKFANDAAVFFESLPYELLKELGVVILDGEHPGSSYLADHAASRGY